MTVEELKKLLRVHKNSEVAEILNVVTSAVSNWEARGQVSSKIADKALKYAHNHVKPNDEDNKTHNNGFNHESPEMIIVREMFNGWSKAKRKKLLAIALEIDSQED